MRLLTVVVLLCFCLVGCGYHFPGKSGTLPGGVEKLYVPLFVNTTSESRLENKLNYRISQVFARSSKISQVNDREAAEAVLSGTITNYRSDALSYDRNDNIGEYRSSMTVDVVLQRTGSDEVLWKKRISWSSTYRAEGDKGAQYDLEGQAINEITLRIAEEILYQMLDDF